LLIIREAPAAGDGAIVVDINQLIMVHGGMNWRLRISGTTLKHQRWPRGVDGYLGLGEGAGRLIHTVSR